MKFFRTIPFLLFLLEARGFAESKPHTVVCSVTINSDDEIKAFKKIYPESMGFKYIELTDPDLASPPIQASREDQVKFRQTNWFRNACRFISKKTDRCDVLIISGHYENAGKFNGDRKYYFNDSLYLNQEQMEYYSCNQSCPEIFSKVQEVYLFGCNTLGNLGYKPNTKSPILDENYANTKLRMELLFPNANAILGFKGYSPEGKTVAPYFIDYLKDRAPMSFVSPGIAKEKLKTWEKHMLKLGNDDKGIQRMAGTQGVNFTSDDKIKKLQSEHCSAVKKSYVGFDLLRTDHIPVVKTPGEKTEFLNGAK